MKKIASVILINLYLLLNHLHPMESKPISLEQLICRCTQMTNKLFTKAMSSSYSSTSFITHGSTTNQTTANAFDNILNSLATLEEKIHQYEQILRNTQIRTSVLFHEEITCDDWVDCQICENLNSNIIKMDNCGWLVETFIDSSTNSSFGIRVWFLHKESLYSEKKLKEAYTNVIRHIKDYWEGLPSETSEYYLATEKKLIPESNEYYYLTKKKSLALNQENVLLKLIAKKLGLNNAIIVSDDNTTIYLSMKKDIAPKVFKLFF